MIDTNLHTNYPFEGAYDCDHRNYNPGKPKIKHILWKHYDTVVKWDSTGKARPCVLDNIQKSLLCNTVYLGYDLFECSLCDNYNLVYHHCHSRFCTSCGTKNQKILASKAQYMCLDVPHRHIVFTVPQSYRIFFRKDRHSLNFLFVAARNTICKLFNESLYRKIKRKYKKKGITKNPSDNYYFMRNYKDLNDFGMIATLHTFGRPLNWNPHIHCLIPELSYNSSKKSYKHFKHFDFNSLRKTWQYEINRLLSDYFKNEFKPFMNCSYNDYNNGFYVYAKSNPEDKSSQYSKNVAGCVNYMMRYASRPPMAESRIISYDEDTDDVCWFYDDHATNERITVKEKGIDLLKKMIIHIPDENFRMVRYYGFYNQKKQDTLYKIHELLGNPKKLQEDKKERKKKLKQKLSKHHYRTMMMDSYNRDILRCKCGSLLVYVDTYNPLQGATNGRNYRQSCIDNMRKMQIRRNGNRDKPRYS